MKDTEPTRNRPKPGVPMVETLRAAVAHDEARLELSRRLLRDWLVSHPEDEEKPKQSVYATRGLTVLRRPR